MLRGTLAWVLSLGLVCTVALSLIAGAAPAPSTAPAAPAPAVPAPTVPAPSVPAPDLASLLQASGLAFTQPDKTQPTYHVTVEGADNSAILVFCNQSEASWKYPDGGTVRLVHFWSQLTPWYTQDNAPPAKFMRSVLEQNDKNWFSAYNITTDQTNGTWSLWVDSYLFLRGTTPDVLKDCVLILSGAATTAKTQLVPLVTAK